MTRGWITCRCWRSPASRRAPRSAGTTSRKSTCRACSRTWPALSSARPARPAQVRHLIDRAMRIAKGERRVTALVFPNDLQEANYTRAAARARHGAFRCRLQRASGRAAQADLRRAAEVLNAGKKVAILVGAGALHATDEVIAVADKLGAGVAKALLGKAALPDDLPWVTGSIGLLGTKPSWEMMIGLRHAADDRVRLSLFGVPAEGGPGARRADRPRSRTC